MGSVDEQGHQVIPGSEIMVTDVHMGEMEKPNEQIQDIADTVLHSRTISDQRTINVQVGLSVIAQMKPNHQESSVLPIHGMMSGDGSICKQDRTKYKLVGNIVHTVHESRSSTRITNICVYENSKMTPRGDSLLPGNQMMVPDVISPQGGSVLQGSEMMTISAQGGSVLPGSEMMTISPQRGSVLPGSEMMVLDVRMSELETLNQQTQALADTFPKSLTVSDQSAINVQRESSFVEHGKLDVAPFEGDSMQSPTMMVENGGIGRQETLDIDKQDAGDKVHQIVTDQGVAMARKGSSVDDKNKLDVHSWGGSVLPGSVLNGKDRCIGKQETSYKQNLGFLNMFQNHYPLVARMNNVALRIIPRYYNFHKNASHSHAGCHKQVKSETGNMTPVKLKKGTILASYISTLEDDKEKNLEKQKEMDEVSASSCMCEEVTIQQPPEEQKSAFYLTSDKAPLAENGQKFTGRKGRKDNS